MNKQYIKGIIEKTANGGYQVLASTASVDRQGDVIDQNGWDLENFKKNPVMLWAHDYSGLPVAKVNNIAVDARGLVADYEFASAEANPMAQQIKELVDGGFLSAVSVGFIPKERNGNVISKSELLEISFVPVPANQDALTLMSASFSAELLAKMFTTEEVKGEVADALSEEEAMEAKYEKINEVWEVMSAFCDVYFDAETDVEQFSPLLTEVITLLQTLVSTDGADDDEAEKAKTALTAKFAMVKSKTTDGKVYMLELIQKIGATHSSATKEKVQGAIDSMKQAIAVLEGMLSTQASTSEEEDGEKEVSASETDNVDELRSLLTTRSLLRADNTGNYHALTAVNDLIKRHSVAA